MNKSEVLGRLRVLSNLTNPVWLAGGVSIDFHVGRWTRDHGDIDLVAFEEHRASLDEELTELGFTRTHDRGWITNWTSDHREYGEVSLAYVRRMDETSGALVMLPSYTGIAPGIYPGVPGGLSPDRFGQIDDVRFRISSPEEDWAYTMGFATIRPGAVAGEKVEHNLSLLRPLVSRVDELNSWYADHRLPLDDVQES